MFINRVANHTYMGAEYASDLNRMIADGKFRELIQLSEGAHDRDVVDIAEEIADSKKRIVLIAGPSSSGKTTFAKKLCIQLRVNGLDPLYMGTDDYFVEREETPVDENGEKNYENLDAVDTALFNSNMNDLLNGKEVDLPTFNFLTGHKEYGKRVTKLEDNQILVIEGIHALNDLMTSEIPNEEKYRVFICPTPIIKVEGFDVDPMDYRILRRMARDFRTRGYSAQDTIKAWPKVRAGEEKNIFPFKGNADVEFNSSHIYEIPVLKKYTWPLLSAIEEDDETFETARRILSFLKEFDTFTDESIIPTDSVLREFVGGSLYNEGDLPADVKSEYNRWYQLRY